jgi:rare lipoprotein A
MIARVVMGKGAFALSAILLVIVQASAGAAERGHAQSGIAAVYSYPGGRSASGERLDPRKLTAAHRSLPFGSIVRVTNLRNGRSTEVRINDRGPFTRGRVIDLSPAAAHQLGFSGLTKVELQVAR